jgi:hypothetical protein
LDPGQYLLTATSQDLAGNKSPGGTQESLTIIGTGEPTLPPVHPDPLLDPLSQDPIDEDTDKGDAPENFGPDLPDGNGDNDGDTPFGSLPGDSTDEGQGAIDDRGTTEPPGTTLEDITENTAIAIVTDTVQDVARAIIGAVRRFIDHPRVEAVTKSTVVPVVAIAAAANLAVGFQLPQFFALLRYLFSQPFVLLRMRKRKQWGVVYNAYTKQPLDLTVVRVIDSTTGRVVQSRVTDFQGRYFIIAVPGTYRIEADKVGFSKVSNHLKGKKEDLRYINLYHGDPITVTEKDSVLVYSIPLDPIDTAVSARQILKEHTSKLIQQTVSLIGIVLSLFSLVVAPSVGIAVVFVIHVLLYTAFYKLAHRKLPTVFGVVAEAKTGKPLGKTVVRIFDYAYNKLVDTHITDTKGRYAALVGPSVYYATFEKPTYQVAKTPPLDYSSEKTKGLGGIITQSIVLVRTPTPATN